MHTYIHTYIHTYKRIYINAYAHTHTNTYVQEYLVQLTLLYKRFATKAHLYETPRIIPKIFPTLNFPLKPNIVIYPSTIRRRYKPCNNSSSSVVINNRQQLLARVCFWFLYCWVSHNARRQFIVGSLTMQGGNLLLGLSQCKAAIYCRVPHNARRQLYPMSETLYICLSVHYILKNKTHSGRQQKSISYSVYSRQRSRLRHCATSRKVAGSITDVIIGIFHWHNPSGRTMSLWSTQPLK
jgi:hypothetical protein